MEDAYTQHEMGGGKTFQSVKLRGEWAKIIADAQVVKHPNTREASPEELQFIREARGAAHPVEWRKICEALGCSEGWAMKQYRGIRFNEDQQRSKAGYK